MYVDTFLSFVIELYKLKNVLLELMVFIER